MTLPLSDLLEVTQKVLSDDLYDKICLWLIENLQNFETHTGLNLYYHRERERKRRPFLSVFCGGNTFVVIFLSTSERGHKKSVDLSHCEKTNCDHFSFLNRSFLFQIGKGYLVLPLTDRRLKSLQEDGTVRWCGCCQNLERLKRYCKAAEGGHVEQ